MKKIAAVFLLLTLATVGCKVADKKQSGLKDVEFKDFVIVEVCDKDFHDADDVQCKIQKTVDGSIVREIPSAIVYADLGLSHPSGSKGQAAIIKLEDQITRISPPSAAAAEIAELETLKKQVAQKNLVKENLAKGYKGAFCNSEATIGASGISCDRLAAAMKEAEVSGTEIHITWNTAPDDLSPLVAKADALMSWCPKNQEIRSCGLSLWIPGKGAYQVDGNGSLQAVIRERKSKGNLKESMINVKFSYADNADDAERAAKEFYYFGRSKGYWY